MRLADGFRTLSILTLNDSPQWLVPPLVTIRRLYHMHYSIFVGFVNKASIIIALTNCHLSYRMSIYIEVELVTNQFVQSEKGMVRALYSNISEWAYGV